MKKFYFLFYLFFSLFIYSQNPGDIAQNFGAHPGSNGGIRTIQQQTDGKILVGGGFTLYNGLTGNRIIRLNADGSKDNSFNTGTGFNNFVTTIQQQTDGKILVGGNFTLFNGVTENRIIRLNIDGSKDTSFNTGTGFQIGPITDVQTIQQQTDGKILVGGGFTSFNGVTENYIIRLNADGSKDSSFNTGTGFNNVVSTIQQQTDGKILVGGGFTSFNGVTENYIIRLNADGSKDTSFNIGTGFDNSVSTIQQQTDGKILVGGSFTSFKGVTENYIIRLNADGSKDTSFNTGTGFNSSVSTIQQQTDGKILVAGYFTLYSGLTGNHIIRLNADGSKDTVFNTGTGFGYSWAGGLRAIKQQIDGKILVGGDFYTFNNVTEFNFIRLNDNGLKDTSFITGDGFNQIIRTIEKQTDGKILVGGNFISYKGVNENNIIRLNADGSKDTSFNSGTGFNNNISSVIKIQQQTDGKILVGGGFTSFNGLTENRIIRLNIDGSKDTSFNTGFGFNNRVQTIQQQANGKILVGGSFTSYKGVTENYIIRLNADGSKDTSFITGTGFNFSVSTIQQQTDGKILVGGGFTSFNGVTENRIIRLNIDGSKDSSFNTGTGFNSSVSTIQQQTDGKILVGGGFTSFNGVTENYIIRLNADGSKDTSFNSGTGFNSNVLTIQQQTDGKILVGGNFTSFNGVTENFIIRLNIDGSKDTSFNSGTGFNGGILTIQQLSSGKILVGGGFTTYKDDNNSAYLIGLHSVQSLSNDDFNVVSSMVIYPNPVKDMLYLQLNNFSTIQSVKIYDLQGKLVIENGSNSINASNLSKGLYLAKVETDEGTFNKKFIKE